MMRRDFSRFSNSNVLTALIIGINYGQLTVWHLTNPGNRARIWSAQCVFSDRKKYVLCKLNRFYKLIWNRHHLKGNQPICSEKHLSQGLESMIFRWFYMHLLMFSPRGGRGDTLGIRQSNQSLPPRIWQTTLPQGRDFRCLSYKMSNFGGTFKIVQHG